MITEREILNLIKRVAYDPNDTARTTIKETNIHDIRTGPDSNQKGATYDPNDGSNYYKRN